MTLFYIAKLGLTLRNTKTGTQKIDNMALKKYEIIIIKFSIKDKL